MIEVMLSLFICSSATECRWVDIEPYVEEQECHYVGRQLLLTEEAAQRYRCTMQLVKWR
jgi:hypothetical protein